MARSTHPSRPIGPKLEPHQIIVRPIITEKGTHQSTHRRAYPFEVNLWATKDEIRSAIEELFNVSVEKVRTQVRIGKQRRFRNAMGRLSHWKKAVVTLHADSAQIEFF